MDLNSLALHVPIEQMQTWSCYIQGLLAAVTLEALNMEWCSLLYEMTFVFVIWASTTDDKIRDNNKYRYSEYWSSYIPFGDKSKE